LGVVLRFVSTTLDTKSLAARGPGEIVLTVFSLVTAIGAGAAVWFYWNQIKAQLPGIFEAGGALVVLVGGMIARTVMSNLDAGQPPLEGGWWHWLRPLLVSPVLHPQGAAVARVPALLRLRERVLLAIGARGNSRLTCGDHAPRRGVLHHEPSAVAARPNVTLAAT
jgi:hypothetical protein